MAGMQFEYDEEGGTFFYFLISFWALVLIPSTYFLWPSKEEKDKELNKRQCECQHCLRKNRIIAKEKATIKPTVIKISLAIGWIIFILLAYKVSMIQLDYVEYDPFTELSVERGASDRQIKKAYHKLSLQHHPDRGGDPAKFMRISKAYAALTNEESKKNWEEYGNPDGPGATSFGIALPKWIIERENSMWVLALYGLVFMIILPVVVGVWWYRSIKFSGDQVLLDTTRLYYYFINKTSNMILKRAVMILAASCEFDRMHNAEIIERPTDNEELPMLIKQLQNVQEKNKERPLCFAYSVKARTLLLAHFQRVPLNPNTLQIDQDYLLKKCPYLINDMVNICASLVAMAMSGRVSQPPRLDTIENIMKMSQMVTQALDEKSSPLQMLPHITSDMLRHFTTRKRDIRHIRDLVAMNHEERRLMLRGLTDDEYIDVMIIADKMPDITMKVRTEVLDEEDTTITAGAIVTVTVSLERKDMGMGDGLLLNPAEEDTVGEIDGGEGDEENEDEEAEEGDGQVESTIEKKQAAWDKKNKGKKKGGAKKKGGKVKQVYQWKAVAQAKVDSVAKPATESGKVSKSPKPEKKVKDSPDADEEGDDVSENEEPTVSEEEEEDEKKSKESKAKKDDDDDDDDDWDQYKMESKKENSLDTKKKESHLVHCPHFPGEKQEGWWVYVADRKHHLLITAPVHVQTLKTVEEVQLKFSAPDKPGIYQFNVVLKSDSYYVDFDQSQNVKLDVREAKVIEDHPQWDISDEEDEKEGEGEGESEDSDYSSDEDSD